MPSRSEIFVFGSNLKGIHGAGAAKYAVQNFNAKYGQGEGLQGNSYAIPTKTTPWIKMSLAEIQLHVKKFLDFAATHTDLTFRITRIGCGLAGYTDTQIAPFFKGYSSNCLIPEEWKDLI